MSFEQCPKCHSKNIYFDSILWICPECFHEWDVKSDNVVDGNDNVIKDAFGNVLNDGDSVTLIKELKVKGASSALKIGTKVKNIKLGNFAAGHDISCKIEGFGFMNLKSEFVKKA